MAHLQALKTAGCGGCKANKGCGVGILGQYFGGFVIKQTLEKNQKIGDVISLSIERKTLLWHAFSLYILPLLGLFFGAILAEMLFPEQDVYQILFGLSGLALSLFGLNIYFKNN